MACPKCRCKTTYTYCEDDILGLPGDQERCANCGAIFFVDDAAEDDEDEDDQFRGTTEMMVPNAEVRGDAPLYGAASLSTDGLCSTVEAEK